ncbi:MAG: phosphodiester glycosidase family protein [Clostridia bacterium]|nr:phosphodiester glycosidase family protein [Clostridia bacterium]
MKRLLQWALLAAMIFALALLAPSPALVEEIALNPAQAVPIPLDAAAGYPPLEAGYAGDCAYQDATIRVEIAKDVYCDTPVYVARVRVADASQLRTMLADKYGSQRTVLATRLAERGNAVLAVNGDYYSYMSTGLVVRQGKLWRCRPDAALDALIIDTNGDLHAVKNIDEAALDEAMERFGGAAADGGSIAQALTFGPALVIDGKRAHETFVRPDGGESKRTQRMVIAQDAPLSYLLVCCEGPDNDHSRGLTLEEMAQYVLSLGVNTAYNLDGGGSATMVFRGEKINALSTSKNRSVSDIVYFCTALRDGGDGGQ